ncbi:MAG: helix-turn-helix domain-containing protein [Caulobacterales bacterium]
MPERLGRANQRRRTRKDLLDAAARLMKAGKKPTLEEVAEAALVSRATAYRYFATIDALLNEAALDFAFPDAAEIFRNDGSVDPIARLECVDDAVSDMLRSHETQLRLMLAASMQRAVSGEQDADAPLRQNRRKPLIEAALAPARHDFKAAQFNMLVRALSLVIGTEAMVVFKDVLQTSDVEAVRVRRWMIRALVEAAKKRT